MTDEEPLLHRLAGEATRRRILKTGAVATTGLGIAAAGTGSSIAQDGGNETDDGGEDDGVIDDQEWDKAIMPVSQFRPNSRFVITSPVIRWQPNVPEVRDNVWSEYNTRTIRYLDSNQMVLFWQAHDAEVPEFDEEQGYVVDAEGDTGPNDTPQPEVFRMRRKYAPFGDSGFVTVNFTPVGEDEEDDLLDDDDWWYAEDEDPAELGDDLLEDEFVTGNQTDGNATDGNTTD